MRSIKSRSIVVYHQENNKRSKIVCSALAQGAYALGAKVKLKDAREYSVPEADIATFYGLAGKLRDAKAEYVLAGKNTVFIDLGYWGREKEVNRGHHRVAINSSHPLEYFNRGHKAADRIAQFNLQLKPLRTDGSHILLCGQSPKSAWACGLEFETWEYEAVEIMRHYTNRQIFYRPKPNAAKHSRRPPHTEYADPSRHLSEHLADAWAVVSHHSNAGIDAITEGLPVFAADGAALALGLDELTKIESPRRYTVEDRDRAFANLAYCQWTIAEMASGEMWRHIESERILR